MLASLLAGNRGKSPQEFVVFLAMNVIFIHVITLLWSEILKKPIVEYRIYFSATFTLWIALSAVINTKFASSALLKGVITSFVVPFAILLTQGLVAYIYLFFTVDFFALTKFLHGLVVSFLYCFPAAFILGAFRSLHFSTRQIARVIWRISFFLTPVIWMPLPDQVSGKANFIDWNPLYYGFSKLEMLLEMEFYRVVVSNAFYFLFIYAAVLSVFILQRLKMSRFS